MAQRPQTQANSVNFKQNVRRYTCLSASSPAVPYHLLQSSVKVGRIKPPRCSTLPASRVNRLRVREPLDPVDQRLVRPNCQDQVESARMHLIIGRISFTRLLLRTGLEQRGVKDGIGNCGSSHDTRGDENAIRGGHDPEMLRKGIEYVVLGFRCLATCPSFVIQVVGIAGPESPDDGCLTPFNERPRSPFSKLVLINFRNGTAKVNEPRT